MNTKITNKTNLPAKLMRAIFEGDDRSLRALNRLSSISTSEMDYSKKLYERKWGRGTFPLSLAGAE
jgi:hypothetical protein